jgi:hypothetical protein
LDRFVIFNEVGVRSRDFYEKKRTSSSLGWRKATVLWIEKRKILFFCFVLGGSDDCLEEKNQQNLQRESLYLSPLVVAFTVVTARWMR